MVEIRTKEKEHFISDVKDYDLIVVKNGSYLENAVEFHTAILTRFINFFGKNHNYKNVRYGPMIKIIKLYSKPLTVIERNFLDEVIATIINAKNNSFDIYLGIMPRRKEDVAMLKLTEKSIVIDDKSYVPESVVTLFTHLLQVVGLEQTVVIITLLEQMHKRCMQ